MRHPIYEARLKHQLSVFPRELCFMLSAADMMRDPEKLANAVGWVADFPKIKKVIIHISTMTPDKITVDTSHLPGTVRLVTGDYDATTGTGSPEIIIAVGKSGKQEICEAIAALAAERCRPEDINEAAIESHLKFLVTPDFVIKTGGSHLTDFLIWQSVYSELFFTEVNWSRFRRVDFLRAMRDFQTRIRRFGR